MKYLAKLYAGTFFQFTIGLIGFQVLWTFMSPPMFGEIGFRFINFGFCSLLITVLQLSGLFLTSFDIKGWICL